MRAFLAVGLEPPTAGQVASLVERLRATIPDVRWSRPDGLHVTVRFLGSIGDEETARVVEAARSVAEAEPPFLLRLGELGGFPTAHRPRVLVIGLAEGAAQLGRIAARCEERLVAAGIDREERPFHAHCTLGRPRQPWPPPARRAWGEAVAGAVDPAPAPMTATRLTLFESIPERGGARYVARIALPFVGASPGTRGEGRAARTATLPSTSLEGDRQPHRRTLQPGRRAVVQSSPKISGRRPRVR